MGLTASSTGSKINDKQILDSKSKYNYTVAIAGNPNVGKSTVFNNLTGMHQHTGNWPGKTVSNASGVCSLGKYNLLLVDIPGTYSLMSNSEEEEIARDYICFGNPNVTVVIVDATCLERNLNLVYQVLEITPNVVVCVNLLDEAKKKGININIQLLSKLLGVPVVGTIARKKKTLDNLVNTIESTCESNFKKRDLNPNLIRYPAVIEECVNFIYDDVRNELPKDKKYITRWICLKLIDGNKKIISSIEENFNIDFSKFNSKLLEIRQILLNNNIDFPIVKEQLISSILFQAEIVCQDVCTYSKSEYNKRDKIIDKILTSKTFGIPIMLLFLAVIFYITIVGANYPSQLLSTLFGYIKEKLIIFFNFIHVPLWLKSIFVDGIYSTLASVISVMLPPMAIFFPLFTLLEDLGYLPRIAFNLDKYFKKACSSGKQALTMCMGFGCNAAGVIGSRIIESPREKLIAILTNNFVPCNGRFPFIITISTIFIACFFQSKYSSFVSTIVVLLIVLFGIIMTLLISKLLSKTILNGIPSSFVLELPPYRKPQIGQILIRSILDRTLFVLGRAVIVAIPCGIVIWLFANININGCSILTLVANFLDPFATLMGLDGYILLAFILGFPANEIVLPIILMSYLQSSTMINVEDISSIGNILIQNGWTLLTGINVMLFSLLHFPCSTTLLTIKKETNSLKWTFISFILPTTCGIILCIITNFIWNIFV